MVPFSVFHNYDSGGAPKVHEKIRATNVAPLAESGAQLTWWFGAPRISGKGQGGSECVSVGVMASALLQMNVKNCTFTPLVAREEALL